MNGLCAARPLRAVAKLDAVLTRRALGHPARRSASLLPSTSLCFCAQARCSSSKGATKKAILVARAPTLHVQRLSKQTRSLHTTTRVKAEESTTRAESPAASSEPTYDGPLVRTFARLKLFSLGSLFLAAGMCPVLMLAPGAITTAGRIGLCATALATSGFSTALIAWIGGPYVGRMRLVQSASGKEVASASNGPALQMETLSFLLRPIRTTVFQPSFLRSTSRPFATWELAATADAGQVASSAAGQETLVAESVDIRSGKVTGRWWAAPDRAGSGALVCRAEGKPVRYFNVHDELLGDGWRIL